MSNGEQVTFDVADAGLWIDEVDLSARASYPAQSLAAGRITMEGSRSPSAESRIFGEAIGRLRREEASDSAAGARPTASRMSSLISASASSWRTGDLQHEPSSLCREAAGGTLEWYRRKVRKIVTASWFDAIIGTLVLVNALMIGVEQDYRLDKRYDEVPETFAISEHVFLSIYTVELFARFFGCGWRCIEDNCLKFDCLLVGASILYAWVLKPLETISLAGGPLIVLRMVRLARLARALRLFSRFRVLWMLVRGLYGSAETMIHTLIVLLIMLYVFALIGTELITLRSISAGEEVPEEVQAVVNGYFATLPDAMLTLMQFVCLDSIGAIYRPMIQYDYGLAAYFMVIILIVPIVLMNLVTAIIVNGAMEQAAEDKDAQKLEKDHKHKKLLRKLGRLFHEMDVDGSGKVSREEMDNIGDEEKEILCQLCGVEDDPLVIFDKLDVDSSGELDIDEFCSGIEKAVTAATPIEMQRMEKLMEAFIERQRETDKAIRAGMSRLQASLNCGERPDGHLSPSSFAVDFDCASPDKSCGISHNLPGEGGMREDPRLVYSAADDAPNAPLGKKRCPEQRRRSSSPCIGRSSPPERWTKGSGEIESLRHQLSAAQATIAVLKQQLRSHSPGEGSLPYVNAKKQTSHAPTEDSWMPFSEHGKTEAREGRAVFPDEAQAESPRGAYAAGKAQLLEVPNTGSSTRNRPVRRRFSSSPGSAPDLRQPCRLQAAPPPPSKAEPLSEYSTRCSETNDLESLWEELFAYVNVQLQQRLLAAPGESLTFLLEQRSGLHDKRATLPEGERAELRHGAYMTSAQRVPVNNKVAHPHLRPSPDCETHFSTPGGSVGAFLAGRPTALAPGGYSRQVSQSSSGPSAATLEVQRPGGRGASELPTRHRVEL